MKNTPNIITCLNLFAGCMACVMAMQGNYLGAFIFIVIAAVFDFLDGFAARLLKAYSDIGKELDSLADVISFGLAPGLLVFCFLQTAVSSMSFGSSIPFLAFLIPIFSAVRLAKFNIDTRQSTSFLGLPVPADALFWSALIPTLHHFLEGREVLLTISVLCLVLLFCMLMISEIPMFSLKFKHFGWKGNELQYVLILLSVLLVSLFHLPGVSLSILVYILISIFNNAQQSKKG